METQGAALPMSLLGSSPLC
uniref:Uncharacterized protein n=1 Tax=Anguilla anguilla TaxID=7936 RepID=A0A0E9SFQ6_ANGAN